MRTQIQVVPLKAACKTASTRIYLGRRDALLSDEVIKSLPKDIRKRWEQMLDACEPGDQGGVIQTWTKDDCPQRIVIGVLPEACSRHNTPARTHGVSHVLKGVIPSTGETAIIAACESANLATGIANGIARALPVYTRKSSSSNEDRLLSIAFICNDEQPVDGERLLVLMEATRFAARLVDMPASELNTDVFVDLARDVASEVGAEITVLEGEALAHAGMGGLWGVGKAAVHLPALVILDHNPGNESQQTISWVGKGIVYDTGGLSIKGKTGMPGMKTDMGGAAAVLAAFKAAVQLNVPHRVMALLCLAENSVGPEATRPDDILTMYSGRTVEVNNTDAEGRLVLADGVAYTTRHHKPDLVIDLATLTGAQMVSTGHRHAGIVCNDETIENIAIKVGKETGDLVHPLPYCPEFFRGEFKSAVADMKNSVKDRLNAQSSCAGQFIAEHLGEYSGPWLHVDLAGPSRSGERATGYGTHLLVGIVESL